MATDRSHYQAPEVPLTLWATHIRAEEGDEPAHSVHGLEFDAVFDRLHAYQAEHDFRGLQIDFLIFCHSMRRVLSLHASPVHIGNGSVTGQRGWGLSLSGLPIDIAAPFFLTTHLDCECIFDGEVVFDPSPDGRSVLEARDSYCLVRSKGWFGVLHKGNPVRLKAFTRNAGESVARDSVIYLAELDYVEDDIEVGILKMLPS